MKRILLVFFICIIVVLAAVAQAVIPQATKKTVALPRFVSLRTQPINARSGPGTKYPIEWIYMQKHAPVEIIAEFEGWRRVRDWQGSESWVKAQMLTSKRFGKIITPGENNLYKRSNHSSQIIAKIEDGVVGEIKKCPTNNDFCLMSFEHIEGWIPKQSIYGIYLEEIIN